jgi:hypothetical protein
VACVGYNRYVFLYEGAIGAISLPYVQSIFKIILICLFILFISLFYKTKPSLDRSDKAAWLLQDICSHVSSGERDGTKRPAIQMKGELVIIEDWLVNEAS